MRDYIARSVTRTHPLWCHWYAKETEKKYGARLARLRETYPDDILTAEFLSGQPRFADHPYWYGGEDEFGGTWHVAEGGVGAHMPTTVVKEWDQLDEYLDNLMPIVSADTKDRFLQVKQIRRDNPDRYVVGKAFRTFFERMHFLRGMDNLFIDFYTESAKVRRLSEALGEFILSLIDGFAANDADAVFLADDWGFQNQLMIRPDLWRELFKPWYRRFAEYAKDKGLQVWFHSCGCIYEIIRDLIECGVQVINPVQVTALDVEAISMRYSGEVSFGGGISNQNTICSQNARQVEDEVRRIRSMFYSNRTGYIGGPDGTIMPETPLGNIESFLKAFRE